MTKTTEEVKYVYQGDGPLLVPKNPNNGVYQETTIRSGKKDCWSSPMFSRIRLILSILALVVCVAVIIVLLTSGSSREQSQEAEIAALKELVENQQTRLHRMQKELQFLISRQQAYEAREDSLKRRALILPSNIGTGTGSNSWPAPIAGALEPKLPEDDSFAPASDSELPMLPVRDTQPILEEEPVDVDKLPRASANKKRKGKLPTEDQ